CSSHNLPHSTVNSMSCTSQNTASSTRAAESSSSCTSGSEAAGPGSPSGSHRPETTSSPWPPGSHSPYGSAALVTGFRLNNTPVPDSSPRLPTTIAWTVTAVPASSGRPWCLRYAVARGELHESNTAAIACSSCSHGFSLGGLPTTWVNCSMKRRRVSVPNESSPDCRDNATAISAL